MATETSLEVSLMVVTGLSSQLLIAINYPDEIPSTIRRRLHHSLSRGRLDYQYRA